MAKVLLIVAVLLFAGLLAAWFLGAFSCPDQSTLMASLNATVQEHQDTIASLQHRLDNYECPPCDECPPCPEPEECPECPPCYDLKSFVLPEDVEKWLRANNVNRQDYSDPNEYAIELQKDAWADGYVMSVIVYEEKSCPGRKYLMCQVIIGQRVFLIDPIHDDVKFYRYLP